jgi:hypothetical protein
MPIKTYIFAILISLCSFGRAENKDCFIQSSKDLQEARPCRLFYFMEPIQAREQRKTQKTVAFDAKISEDVIKQYASGKTIREIGKKYGIEKTRISDILKRAGEHIRTNSETKRVHKFNYAYFDIIDCQEKAYFLGFLFADGYVRTDGYGVGINLAETDVSILERFRELIESEKPLRKIAINIPNRQDQYMLSLNSKEFTTKMATLGIVKAKTHKIVFPTYLREDLVRHFIRGYFDGDGCITVNVGKRTAGASLAGTDVFCCEVDRILRAEMRVAASIFHPNKERNKNIRILYWARRQSCLIADYLYKDATIFLERKKAKFDLAKAIIVKREFIHDIS